MPEKPTIKDVASVADVSAGTVSNVLKRPNQVRSDLPRRVEDAIASLGFVPDKTARRLRTATSRIREVRTRNSWTNPSTKMRPSCRVRTQRHFRSSAHLRAARR
ncbi:LacI family DNA-binding transcriptional regulator [Nocardioides sp. CCNWLW216]|uniref:LacI family DNA-binding transcriptional regulator n=1 Tax=unclassified Nocardioides TaxID=2615069 RepID=UPI003FA5EF4A